MGPIVTDTSNRSPLYKFRCRNRLLTVLFLWSLLNYAARGSEETDRTSQFIASNTTLQSSKKSDISIFYDQGSSLCDKHRIAERDTRDEETTNARARRRKDKANERELKKIKQDVVDDDDDEKDLDAEPIKQDRVKPERTEPERQTTTTCGQCRKAREALRNESLELIKGDILSRLGMAHPPDLTGKYKPHFGEFVVQRLLEKYETEKHDKHHYSPRRHTPHSPSVQWFPSDDDTAQMQGDAPPESDSTGSRDSVKDYGDRSNNVRSHMNTSDNRFSEKSSFQEGEVYIEEDDDYHVRTMKVVSFSLPHPKLRHSQPDLQYFSFSDKARANRVKRALLWVYIRGNEWSKAAGNSFNITVYKIFRNGQQGNSPILTPVIGRIPQEIPNGPGAWLSLEHPEMEKLVADWFKSPNLNTGLIINATDRNGNNLAITSRLNAENQSKLPFLEVYVTDMKKHRTKRTLGLNCNESSNETRCCRYPLTVDFEEFGWDWIIAPKTYEANFCDGECPEVFMPRFPHTHLMQMTNVPRAKIACCAPRKLSPISMLYFNSDGTVMYVTLPSMVVDRCGCS